MHSVRNWTPLTAQELYPQRGAQTGPGRGKPGPRLQTPEVESGLLLFGAWGEGSQAVAAAGSCLISGMVRWPSGSVF